MMITMEIYADDYALNAMSYEHWAMSGMVNVSHIVCCKWKGDRVGDYFSHSFNTMP